MNELCATCRYWVWNHQGPDYRTDHAPEMVEYMSGDCRRRAPVRGEWTFDHGGTKERAREWPITLGGDFCGEYR
jgi:hypothetical protein